MSETYKLTIMPDGLIKGVGRCSWYGGPNDKEDNGIGKWGFDSREWPNSPYCSLPKEIEDRFDLHNGIRVTIENAKGDQVRQFLGDEGPAADTGRMIDCCPRTLDLLGLQTDDEVTIYIDRAYVTTHAERVTSGKLIKAKPPTPAAPAAISPAAPKETGDTNA